MKPIVLVSINHSDLTPDIKFTEALLACARQASADVTWVLPGDPQASQARVAACWYPPQSLLEDYPHLRCLHSAGAGTDHFGPLAESGLPIYRIIDEAQKVGMFEYVLWGVLYYQRDMDHYYSFQQLKRWQRLSQRQAKETRISILGQGHIGAYVACRLADMGYPVSGWSKSRKSLPGVTHYAGKAELPDMLSQSDILVNLLPLNAETRGIIDYAFLSQLPPSAAFIHCGRGEHIVANELRAVLENNRLRGALLDVFESEPLPQESNWWQDTPKVLVTPHIASSTSLTAIVSHISQVARQFACA